MRVVIGLGANLGDRLATLREAAARIGRVARIVARSHVWETAPLGGPEQPDYLNAAIVVEWDGEPIALLDACMAIESDLGRVRAIANGPRTIDLDILWIDGRIIDEARLTVPHPRLRQRAFALGPMLEVAAGAVDPRTKRHYMMPSEAGVRRLNEIL